MTIAYRKNLSVDGKFVEDFDSRVIGLLIQLADELTARGWRLATAESCTGDWIAKCCTDLAGSSAWFDRGHIVYSYSAKEDLLGIAHDDLVNSGAVSEEIARQMAEGARERSRCAEYRTYKRHIDRIPHVLNFAILQHFGQFTAKRCAS